MAKTVIDELITLITLKTSKESEGTFKKFNNGLVGIKKTGLLAAAAITAVATGLGLLVNKTNASVANQARFAKSIGVSFENLQELQFAGKLVGATTEDINSSLASLTKTMSSPIPGEYNRELLLLGINIKNAKGQLKPATQVLLEISKAMQGLSRIQQVQLASKLGLNEGTIRLLQEGPTAIKRAMIEAKASGGVIPEGAQEQAIQYSIAMTKLSTSIKGLVSIIVLQVTPSITKFINKLEELITTHSKLFKNIAIVGAALSGFSAIALSLKVVLGVLGIGFSSVASVLGALGLTFTLTAPEVVALVAVLGLLVKFFPQIERAVKKAAAAIMTFFSPAIKAIERDIERVEKAFSKIKNIFKKGTGGGQVLQATTLGQQNLTKIVPFRNPLTRRTTNSSQVNQGGNTNNVTINVSGTQHPVNVAKEVKRQFDLSSALQVASPGFNRPPVA